MPDPLRNQIVEKISRRLKCFPCGRRHRPYDFQFLEERENFSVLEIACRACRKRSVVFAVVRQRKLKFFASELEPDEWRRYGKLSPISRDEVIAMHCRMDEYAGDFTDVLEDPLPPGSNET